MPDQFDVIVVGAGIFGLATATELAARNKRVAVIDRFGSGHPATSSTGRSRGIRIAYDHPFYVSLAQDAIRRWRDLEIQSGRQILHLTGQVDFGLAGKLAAIAAAVREVDGTIDELDTKGLNRKLPRLLTQPGDTGLFHAQAGTVLSDAGMAALKAKVLAQGVSLIEPERVIAIEPGSPTHVVTDQRRLGAQTVVVAAGPWSAALLQQLDINVPLAPSIAQVTFIAAPALVDEPGIGEWGGDSEGLGGVYGHPVPGVGYKIAFSTGQDGWSPDVAQWQPDRQEQARLFTWLDRRMPDFPRQVQLTQRHPWTMTPDGDFIIDRVGPIVLACGCSGHAFKFGPALGPLVADVVDGKRTPDLLRRDRPSLVGKSVAATDTISR
ncbi:MAG TPA: FAD-dependent oxidoreductase [Nordella sp.]|nr:FAD-dependent oxidoreductase [Nordella sp.]